MILVDASIWVDHIRSPDELLATLLARHEVLTHPFVIGEVSLGSMRNRAEVIAELGKLPRTLVARNEDVLHLIEQHRLFGRGIGYVDVHLLTSARLIRNTQLWTRDRRLHEAANELQLAARLTH
jgi:predicted nucleic acid-binding protein